MCVAVWVSGSWSVERGQQMKYSHALDCPNPPHTQNSAALPHGACSVADQPQRDRSGAAMRMPGRVVSQKYDRIG